jgi:uncharacterized damage-inducible protein DinB
MEIKSVETFLDYYEKIRGRTLRVIEAIPPEKMNWSYREGKFTLADLVRHIASTERYMFAETIRANRSRYPGHGPELANGYNNVLAFFDRAHRESVEILRQLNDEDLLEKCNTPAGAPITRWKWLRAMVEHEIHHRGQIYIYLGMLGVTTPPLYGLTSEQVREVSEPPQ